MRFFGVIATLLLTVTGAAAQSSPGLTYGQVPTPAQWNSYFAAKQDVLGYTAVNRGGDTMSGRLVAFGSTPTRAGFSLSPGSAPSAPVDGDIWTTVGGLYVRISGVTIGPLVSSSSLTIPLTTNHIFVGSAGSVATDVAMSGDGVIVASGALTVSKIGGKSVTLGGALTTAGALTTGGAFVTSGAFDTTLTVTGTTGVTLPTAGTLATLAGSEILTNKTLTTPTLTLKQSTTPTPTAEGDIQWDTDDNAAYVGDGSAAKVLSDTKITAEVATTSGTTVDVTGIPSWAKTITINFAGVSTNGTNNWLVQIGDSGGVETSGYLGSGAAVVNSSATNAANSTAGFIIVCGLSTGVLQGSIHITLEDAADNTWVAFGALGRSDVAATNLVAGSKALSPGPLDRIRLTTVGGTDTFDAGVLSVQYGS